MGTSIDLPFHVGKYKVQAELGRGATGVVYLAEDPFKGRQVAIKEVHAHLLRKPDDAERYRRLLRNEVMLTARLRHPNIVRLLDADEQATQPYLVLEYVDGKPLSSYTSPDSLLPVAQVLDIAYKCCNALEHAQREGLVHRDIKPANVLLSADGEVKLTDFGAALAVRSDATQLAGLVGSPSYMSPEQVQEQDLTHHSDMFSLAVVVYEMLTGRRPFDGDTDFATLYRITHEAPTAPRLLRTDLPEHLDAVLLRALAKDPLDRYATWPEFANALLAVQHALPAQRSQDSEAQRFALLRALPFFEDFHDVALWELMRLGRWRWAPKGKVILFEGQPGDSFYVLVQGRVSITREGWQLSVLGPGVTLGEMTYLQPEHKVRSATAVAETDVLVLKVRNPSLHEASADLQSRFDKAFIKVLVSRLEATSKQLGAWELSAPQD